MKLAAECLACCEEGLKRDPEDANLLKSRGWAQQQLAQPMAEK